MAMVYRQQTNVNPLCVIPKVASRPPQEHGELKTSKLTVFVVCLRIQVRKVLNSDFFMFSYFTIRYNCCNPVGIMESFLWFCDARFHKPRFHHIIVSNFAKSRNPRSDRLVLDVRAVVLRDVQHLMLSRCFHNLLPESLMCGVYRFCLIV